MNLQALIKQYRLAAHDAIEPYFVADTDLVELFNEAEQEAALRGRLLHESANPDVCQIVIQPGQASYPLHSALYELTHIRFQKDGDSRSQEIQLSSTEELDRITPQWRERSGMPLYAVQDDTTIRLVPSPEYSGTLYLEGYRLPMAAMEDMELDKPEINPAHHRHLYQWVLHRVFSIPDAEIFDPARARAAEQAFTDYFGARPDSDLRRIVREDEAHTVKPFWA